MAVPGEPPCRCEPGHAAAEDDHAGAQFAGGGGEGPSVAQTVPLGQTRLVHPNRNAQALQGAAGRQGQADADGSTGPQKAASLHQRTTLLQSCWK